MSGSIGKPVSRLDGYEKTMGRARYTGGDLPAEHGYAAIVGATISSGKIKAIDRGAALDADGVIAILTHDNLPPIPGEPRLLPSLVGAPAPWAELLPAPRRRDPLLRPADRDRRCRQL